MPGGAGKSKVANQSCREPERSDQDERIGTQYTSPVGADSAQDDPGISEQIGLTRVILVEFKFSRDALLDVELFSIVAAFQKRLLITEMKRSQVGNSRFVLQNAALFERVILHIARHLRTRAD